MMALLWGQDTEPWEVAQSSVADPSNGQQRIIGKLKWNYFTTHWKTAGRLIRAEQHWREQQLLGLERGLSDPRTAGQGPWAGGCWHRGDTA